MDSTLPTRQSSAPASSFQEFQPCIRVLGIGGAGGNAVSYISRLEIDGIETICINSDVTALRNCRARIRLQIGSEYTRGRGTGGNPEIGALSAERATAQLQHTLSGADIVFLVAGLGGGLGSGAISHTAALSRKEGALTIAIVSMPFSFEGKHRRAVAEETLRSLFKNADTILVVPNDRLLLQLPESIRFLDACRHSDSVLAHTIESIQSLLISHGLVNLDFADVQSVLANPGIAMIGYGEAGGKQRAVQAARTAISSTLLDERVLEGASKILLNISAGTDVTLREVSEAAELIRSHANDQTQIIWGVNLDQSLAGRVAVTLMATGMKGFEIAEELPIASPPMVETRSERNEADWKRHRPRLQSVG